MMKQWYECGGTADGVTLPVVRLAAETVEQAAKDAAELAVVRDLKAGRMTPDGRCAFVVVVKLEGGAEQHIAVHGRLSLTLWVQCLGCGKGACGRPRGTIQHDEGCARRKKDV